MIWAAPATREPGCIVVTFPQLRYSSMLLSDTLGMAVRLAFDLGLHKDMTPYVEQGIITLNEADLRRTIFWGAYLVDQ
jgi:hypothetical protein